ncbi:putative uncharacterized protein [Rhodococcus sp. AW25M09]|nr:putative uncharacterized protein [Rhodococcus sp. AW25M09]
MNTEIAAVWPGAVMIDAMLAMATISHGELDRAPPSGVAGRRRTTFGSASAVEQIDGDVLGIVDVHNRRIRARVSLLLRNSRVPAIPERSDMRNTGADRL